MKNHHGSLIAAMLGIATASTLHAAPITWGAATAVGTAPGNSSDVSTTGALVEAFNGQGNDRTPANRTVNGVTFVGTVALLDGDPKPVGTADLSAGTNGGDASYDELLSEAEYGGGSGLVSISIGDGALTSGYKYQVQVWFVDDRAASNTRVMQYGDGLGNTVDLNDQFSIGTFTAEGTSQTLTLAAQGFGQAHITAYQLRHLAPVATLSTASEPVTGAYTVNINFSEDVTGLEDSDFVVSNGIASATNPATGPASVYTVTITPTASGIVTVDLPAGTTQNAGLTPSAASKTLTTTYVPGGAEGPTVALSSTVAEPTYGAYIVDVVFSEDVSGLDASDFDVVGGTASNVLPASGPASVYAVTIIPTVGGDVEVTLPNSSVLDIDDNLPNAVSNTLVTEYVVPTIPTAELLNPIAGSIVTGTYTVDIFFSEFVSGLELSDFVVTNGTASNLSPASGPNSFYSIDIIPAAEGLVSVFLPAGSVTDDDGENQVNPDSNLLYANNLSAGTFTSGLIDLSGRDVLGLGDGETLGFFTSPKSFGPTTDFSLDDIPWSDGVNSGTFDLSFVATSSLAAIKRGGLGAFGAADVVTDLALIAPGTSIMCDSFAVSDLQGDLAGMSAYDIKLIAVYLGNKTANDGATINGLAADGAAGGSTSEVMRNDINPSPSATILGTGTGNGFSINGIDITFKVGPQVPKFVSAEFNGSNEFVITFSGLDTSTTYELRHSPDLVTPFTLVPGTAKIPAASTDTFKDASPTLPGKGFYQLWNP